MGFGIHNRLQQAVQTTHARGRAENPQIKRLKKDTDASWQAKLDDRAEHLHARCTYHCGALLETTRKRDICSAGGGLCPSQAERNMAEFSDSPLPRISLSSASPPSEADARSTPRAARRISGHLHHAGRSAGSTVPRGCVTEVRRQRVGDPFQSIYAWRGASPGHSVCSSKIPLSAGYKHSRCPSPGDTAV